jgi:flavin reductase (DIM6/NTAB) family NADH-FMN oxidoreductase RutF
VTTCAGARRAGCLVGFASQVSIRPTRFPVGLPRRNHTYRIAQHATHLAVHLLTRRHRDLARLFGGQTGDHLDKFPRCSWHPGPGGVPVLSSAPAWFVGEILCRYDLGDHVGHLIRPVDGYAPATLEDLITYADLRDLEPGHATL